MSFRIGSLVKPFGGQELLATSFGKDLTTEQKNMLDDWNQFKFQKSDAPVYRGIANQSADNAVFMGVPIHEKSGQWFDRHTNFYGDSENGVNGQY